MWRFAPFADFAYQLLKLDDVVGEMIIINNDSKNTPNHPLLSHPKVKIFDFGKNIFVNPAWNIGAKVAKHDILCFLNDDLIFDLRLLYKIRDFFTPNIGAIGLSNGLVEQGQTPLTTGEIEFERFQGQVCFGFGELMFIHKQNWDPIPDGLNIGFGDIFIFEKFSLNKVPIYFIVNTLHYHKGSTTIQSVIKDEARTRHEQEQAIYESIRPSLFNRKYPR